MLLAGVLSLLLLTSYGHLSDQHRLLEALAPGALADHLPTFPIPFTLPIGPDGPERQRQHRFLLFPAADSRADHAASMRRCQVLGARLWQLSTPVDHEKMLVAMQREMLSCVVDGPVFVGSSKAGECTVLMPGGVVVTAEDLCQRSFGSLCHISPPVDA